MPMSCDRVFLSPKVKCMYSYHLSGSCFCMRCDACRVNVGMCFGVYPIIICDHADDLVCLGRECEECIACVWCACCIPGCYNVGDCKKDQEVEASQTME